MSMQVSMKMTPAEMSRVKMQADAFNAKLKAEQEAMGIKPGSMDGQDRYLKLLLKQLQYQDPSSPVKNDQFAAQMAQFSALQQMTKLNETSVKMLDHSRNNGVYGMLGKQIVWKGAGDNQLMRGVADSIGFSGGEAYLNVGTHKVQLQDVVRVEIPEKGR
jgi:flagellar basal-body rod modification protein FlgD